MNESQDTAATSAETDVPEWAKDATRDTEARFVAMMGSVESEVVAHQDDPCISLYCGHRRECHVPQCAFSGCICKAFQEAPTDEEADAYLRGKGIIKKCEVCGQDATLTNDFVTHLMEQYQAKCAAYDSLRQLENCGRSEREHDPMLCNVCNTCLTKRWHKSDAEAESLRLQNAKLTPLSLLHFPRPRRERWGSIQVA